MPIIEARIPPAATSIGRNQAAVTSGTNFIPDITHVIADEIGDNGGVTRVVLRDSLFNLTHYVGPGISRLGKDTATYPGEYGYRRGAEAETRDDGEEIGVFTESKI